jgi:hypothetical protein
VPNSDGSHQNIMRIAERWIAVTCVVGLLLFAVACGGSGSNPLPPINGNFSNASLSGQYAFSISGNQLLPDGSGNSAYYVESGVFTADGNGNITAGTDDFSQSGSIGSNNITGAYSINKDGSGDMIFNVASGQVAFRIAMSDTNHFYMIENDGFGSGAGSGELQTTTAFAAPPNGTFVFRVHESGLIASAASLVGRMTLNTGTITSGNEDILFNGSFSSVTLTGNANFPGNTTGRGTMTVTESSGFSASYIYYVVDANTFRLMRSDGTLALGRAEAQTATTYDNSVLSGSFVFNSTGDTALNLAAAHTVGVFTANGSGAISAGAFDSVLDGNVQSNVSITGGAYNVAASGRATIQLGAPVIINQVAWLVSPNRAFYLVNNPANAEDGVMDKQATVAFSNSTLNGQYAFFMDGFDTAFKDRTGTFIPDGNGNLRQDQVAVSFFPPSAAFSTQSSLSGTYSVAVNGRVTASVNSLSSNIVLYMVSNTTAYSVQADSGFDIGGAIKLQQ